VSSTWERNESSYSKEESGGKRKRKEDIIPSHRGTAEPIWLADFYEKISPEENRKGRKNKEERRKKNKPSRGNSRHGSP
jgi:hypothetical protein